MENGDGGHNAPGYTLRDGIRYIQVPPGELKAVYDMATRDDPVCVAAIREYRRVLASRTLKVSATDLAAPAAAAYVCANYYSFFSDSLVLMFFAFGFCPVVYAGLPLDLGFDADWVRRYGETRRGAVQRGTIGADQEHGLVFDVPVVPAFGTYDVFVFSDEAMQTRVLIEPKQDNLHTPFGMGSSSKGEKPKIVTLFFDRDSLPDATSGKLRSRIACLLSPFQRLQHIQTLSDACDRARANPVTWLQYKLDAASSGTVLGIASQPEDYTGQFMAKRETYDASAAGSEERSNRQAAEHARQITAAVARRSGTEVGAPNPFEVQPPLVIAAPQPPLPERPLHQAEMRAEYVSTAIALLRIPAGMLGLGPVATYEERLDYANVVEDVRAVILKILDETFAGLTRTPVAKRFSICDPVDVLVHPMQEPAVVPGDGISPSSKKKSKGKKSSKSGKTKSKEGGKSKKTEAGKTSKKKKRPAEETTTTGGGEKKETEKEKTSSEAPKQKKARPEKEEEKTETETTKKEKTAEKKVTDDKEGKSDVVAKEEEIKKKKKSKTKTPKTKRPKSEVEKKTKKEKREVKN